MPHKRYTPRELPSGSTKRRRLSEISTASNKCVSCHSLFRRRYVTRKCHLKLNCQRQKSRTNYSYVDLVAGQRSFLSVPEAAAVIVKGCRYHLRAFYGVPGADALDRGLRFSREAEETWRHGGGRLASTLNYALVRSGRKIIDFDSILDGTEMKQSRCHPEQD